MATVADIREDGEHKTFTMRSEIAEVLRIDQSISHNGVCLTVESIANDTYTVTAIYETLIKSNLGLLRPGDRVNIDRSMRPAALLDGHIVQGHVDQTATCTAVESADGSYYYTFEYEQHGDNVTVEKGSVAVNGVSLTVVNSRSGSFQVAIIPYTHEHTNFKDIRPGSVDNIEIDINGKYIARLKKGYTEGR